jgi:hypothetical protein
MFCHPSNHLETIVGCSDLLKKQGDGLLFYNAIQYVTGPYKIIHDSRPVLTIQARNPPVMATTREVYLISISVQNSRDHWGLYFPSTDSEVCNSPLLLSLD